MRDEELRTLSKEIAAVVANVWGYELDIPEGEARDEFVRLVNWLDDIENRLHARAYRGA